MADRGRRRAADVVRVRDGRATWQEVRRHCTQHELRRALAKGEIVRVARGRYALPDQNRAREAAATVGGVLSHLSAAVDLGLAVLARSQTVHVTVPRAAHRTCPAGVVLHRADLAPDDHNRRSTLALRTVLDCAATLPFAEALAVADSALRDGVVRRDDLSDAAAERRGPGAPRVRRVAALADGDAANPFESALRAGLLDAGITGFTPQLPIRLVTGTTVRVDLGDPRRRIVVEADGFEHHGTRRGLRDDCRRYDELVRAGWTVLRFAWEHVLGDPGWVVSVIGDVAAAADRQLHRGDPPTPLRRAAP